MAGGPNVAARGILSGSNPFPFFARILMRMSLLLFALLAFAGLARAGDRLDAEDRAIKARILVIKQQPELMRWLEIPWELNLADAFAIAKAEKRPLFVLAIGEDPLGRC